MTTPSIQSRAEAAAERAVDMECPHSVVAVLTKRACRKCIAAVIAEEIRASEERAEALSTARLAWVAVACAYKSGGDVAHHRTVAEAADDRARELGEL